MARTYEVLGRKDGMGIMRRAMFLEDARQFARGLDCAAVYRSEHLKTGAKFGNATDRDFLLEHYDDPYWLNRGVPSATR